jgi:flotillin
MSYRIAAPDEYLAITGMGIKEEIKITKAAWVLPFQRCMRFSVQPHDYSITLQAMTKEKLQFMLPVVFTVGPHVPSAHDELPAPAHDGQESRDAPVVDPAHALMKYAVLLADNSATRKQGENFLEQKIRGVVEGEVRVIVSSLTMEEIFTERELFKRRIHNNIQSELDQFGLKIYNANVRELCDAPDSVYFESLSRKAHEGATNQARIDVAAAVLRGTVGETERKGQQEREIAKIHAETAVQKTERDIERATAEAKLQTKQTELQQSVEMTRVQKNRELECQDEDLKREVELKRALAEMERLRAVDVVKATITKESKQQAADAKAYEVTKDAQANFEKSQRLTDAAAYKTVKDAEAQAEAEYTRTTRLTEAAAYKTTKDAEAWAQAAIKTAEANLVKKQKEAEGISAMADAYARMSTAFGGPAGLLTYMMIEKGTFVELAKANADGVRGMQPKISVWNTGNQDGAQGSSTDTMRNVYQMLPPLMTTIQDQTGITLPEWQFGTMAAATNEISRATKGQGSHGVNGNN